MEFTSKLKERFCKDYNIPIKLFEEPYFTERIELLDPLYSTKKYLNIFENSVINNIKFNNEQDYFTEYNLVKDQAIEYIKSTEEFNQFNQMDMNNIQVDKLFINLPKKDIFKPNNANRKFISIDMIQANFHALRYYSSHIFKDADTWEEFLSTFTDVEHIICSKYIRQVILGNCNPRRHITYEKYLMSQFLKDVIDDYSGLHSLFDHITFFSNDEIIFDITDIENNVIKYLLGYLYFKIDIRSTKGIPLKLKMFTLHKLEDDLGYYEEIEHVDGSNSIELKCVNSYTLPFILRKLNDEKIQENDKVFIFEGHLAKFIN